jgi:nucleoside phosphorylase
VTALNVETAAVLRQLHELQLKRVGNDWFHVGRFARWTVTVIEIGAGNNRAAAIASRALIYFGPEVAAFVGVAGRVKDANLGDVVVATRIYGYEAGKETAKGFRPRPDVQVSHHELEQRARVIRTNTRWHTRLNQLTRETNYQKSISVP